MTQHLARLVHLSCRGPSPRLPGTLCHAVLGPACHLKTLLIMINLSLNYYLNLYNLN